MSKRKSSSASENPHKRSKPVEEEEVEDANVHDGDQDDHLLSKQVCTVTVMLYNML